MPTRSVERVESIPARYELFAASYRDRDRSFSRTDGESAASAASKSACDQCRWLSGEVCAAS